MSVMKEQTLQPLGTSAARPRRPLIFASEDEVDYDLNPALLFRPARGPASITTAQWPTANVEQPLPGGDVPTPTVPQPMTGPTAAHVDRELDIKYELVTLNKARDDNKAAMQELLYELHELMSATGRASKFAAFLRNELGWTDKYASTKASRWIAAHELRAGLITKETYDKRMGNGTTTLRSDSPSGSTASQASARPVAPALQLDFTVQVDADVPEPASPAFTATEIAAAAEALTKRKDMFYTAVLFRAYYPKVYLGWLLLSWKIQRGRHRTKTYAETIAAISLSGLRLADEDDEWGQCLDEMLREIGANPAVALARDCVHPDDREELEAGGQSDNGLQEDGALAWEWKDSMVEGISDFDELTLDDLDDKEPFRF